MAMRTRQKWAIAPAFAAILVSCGGDNNNTPTSAPAMNMAQQVLPHRKIVASDYQAVLQELYISSFGRPADPAGLVYWEGVLLAGNAPTTIQGFNAAYSTNAAVNGVVNSFGNSAESVALYGSGNATVFITAIYQDVLGRATDQKGLDYWAGLINTGAMTQGQAALAIMAAAASEPTTSIDEQIVNNRLIVANYFTAQVSSQNAGSAYSGNAANVSVRAMLNAVTTATDTTAYEATVTSTIATLRATATSTVVTGTAATGMALAGASITLTDANGVSKVTTSSANGSYTIDVTGLSAPFVVKATGTQPFNTASFAGHYTGTFAGGMTGTFAVTMAPQGITSACSIALSLGQFSCKGALDSTGRITITQSGVSNGVTLTGSVSGNCSSISGTWNDSAYNLNGTFSGSGSCSGPVQVNLVSALDVLHNSSSNVVNITPLTTVIAAQLSSTGVASNLSPVTDKSAIVSMLGTVDASTQTSIATLMAEFGASGSPITTQFAANGSGYDKLYDNIIIGTFPKLSATSNNIFIGPIAIQNGCYVNAAGTGCVTYSDPGTQTTTNPNLCGSDIATGAGIPCDPSQPINSQPSVALPAINSTGGIAISGPGVRLGSPDSSTPPITAAQCSALKASLAALLGSSVPSAYTSSWGSLISLVQSDIAQSDAACALAGISCAAIDTAGNALISLLRSYENTYGNQFWGNQCP
jgi:hypothetical protein